MKQARENITCVKSIAERLKKARDDAGLTQPALAQKAGVSAGTIGNIESGARKEPRELLAIARAVGVNPDWLKSGKGPMKPTEGGNMTGWPLSPELLAALQNIDAKTARRVENVVRSALDMDTVASPAASQTKTGAA